MASVMSTSTESTSIRRIERPTPKAFDALVASDKPAIITGAMTGWKALSLWTVDYLKSTVGKTRVPVSVSPDGVWRDLISEYKIMQVGDFLDAIGPKNTPRSKTYLACRSLSKEFPVLLRDIEFPVYLKKDPLKSVSWGAYPGGAVNLWISPGDTVSSLHYDFSNNLIALVSGRKRFVLFAPAQHSNLYPFSNFNAKGQTSDYSQVNIEQPDLQRFPKFAKARSIEATVEAGEMLFLPSLWWHQVYSTEMGIAVNFWWRPALSKFFTRQCVSTFLRSLLFLYFKLRRRQIPA